MRDGPDVGGVDVRRAHVFPILLALVVVPGCRRSATSDAGTPVDAGPGLDAGMQNLGPAFVTLEYAATVAALTAGPLTTSAATLQADGLTVDNPTIQNRVRDGVSGNSIVTDPACVGWSWAGRTATITFSGCVSEATGL